MKNISVLIITKNEEEMIGGCLRSIRWVDEIIIIDAYSTDKTCEIARKYTDKVFKNEWRGFVEQRMYGIEKTKNDWVLILDADERISHHLKEEIEKEFIFESKVAAYDIPFINIFLGKPMKYGGWNPEYHTRLFNKKASAYIQNELVHEEIMVRGRIKRLKGPIFHLSHRDIASNLLKTRNYAILESRELFKKRSPKVGRLSLLMGVVNHFIRRYILDKGYKDGMEGFVEAMYQAFSQIFVIQTMLWEKQRGKSSKEIYCEIDKKIAENDYNEF